MKVKDLKSRVTYYKEKIKEFGFHPYLNRYIEEPVIDEDKLHAYIHLFDYVGVDEEWYENYLLSVMFVQMALDTHDYVSSDNRETRTDIVRERQLTVLAGDYYSGLYYHLLSLVPDLPFIQILARSIREVNEQKVRLYYREDHTEESLFETYKKVETLLAYNVWCHFLPESASGILVESVFIKSLGKWRGESSPYIPGSPQAVKFADFIKEKHQSLMEDSYMSFQDHCTRGDVSGWLCESLKVGMDERIS